MSDVVVIGLGNPFRRDDGLGHAAAAAVADRLPATTVVLLDGEATRLVDAWAGKRLAVVIDAVSTGDPPGTLHRIEVGVDTLPDPPAGRSTHGAGLATAVALGRALGRNPELLVVYGVEPGDFSDGRGLGPSVRNALAQLVERIVTEVQASCA